MSDLRQQALTGLGWSGASQVVRQVLQFIIGILLARLLTPAEFGLLGMVAIFTGFAALFGDLGLGAALIQRPDLDDDHLNAAFWANACAGAALTLLFLAGAPLVAGVFGEPALEPITRLIALQFVIGSLGVVQSARLSRRMNFRVLARIEVGVAAIAGGVGIALALAGYGVWSLVAQALCGSALSVAWMWAASPWRPAFSLRRDSLRELLGFSSSLLGFSALNYWMRNADDLLIGRVVGPAALGIYTRAYGLMLLPLQQVSAVVGRVMFPALSSIQHDVARVREIYLRAIGAIALVTFPLMIGLLVVADHFVLALYGAKWAEVVPILRVFCLLGLIQSIGATVGWIYQSQGRTDLMLRWGVVAAIVILSAFGIGIRWGAMGVAVAYVVASGGILAYPSFVIPGRLIGLRFGDLARALAPTFCCAGAMGLGVWITGRLLPSGWPHGASLAAQVGVGASLYLALVRVVGVAAYRDLRALAAERYGRLAPDAAAAGP